MQTQRKATVALTQQHGSQETSLWGPKLCAQVSDKELCPLQDLDAQKERSSFTPST